MIRVLNPELAKSIKDGEVGNLLAAWPSWPPLEQTLRCNHHIALYQLSPERYAILVVISDETEEIGACGYDELEESVPDIAGWIRVATELLCQEASALPEESCADVVSLITKSIDIFAMHLCKAGMDTGSVDAIRALEP